MRPRSSVSLFFHRPDGTAGPEIVPGPLSDQVTSLLSDAGLAVTVTGPEIVWAPEGVMVNVGGVPLPAQAARIRDTAANIRVRIDVSAKIWAVKSRALSFSLEVARCQLQ